MKWPTDRMHDGQKFKWSVCHQNRYINWWSYDFIFWLHKHFFFFPNYLQRILCRSPSLKTFLSLIITIIFINIIHGIHLQADSKIIKIWENRKVIRMWEAMISDHTYISFRKRLIKNLFHIFSTHIFVLNSFMLWCLH